MLIVTFDVIKIKSNTPILENMSPSELRFTHETKDLHDAKFVAQRKIVKGDYLKRKEIEGVFKNVYKVFKTGGEVRHTTLDKEHDKELTDASSRLNDGDNASREYELYEAYLKVDYNNDGIMENVIVHAVGDTPLKISDNSFEMPPFFIFSPEYEPYAIFNEDGFAEEWEQLQDLKTALVHQMIIATAKNGRGQKFVDETAVDMDAVLDGDEYVGVRGNPTAAVMFPPSIPTDPNAMTLVQYAQNELKSQSGSTRYNQGLDSNKYPAMAMKKVFSPHGFTELDKKILEESGVMNNINMSSDAGGYTQNRRYDKIKENKLYKWLITPALFEKCDLQMRQVAVLGAYYQGIEKKGMKIPNGKEISPEAIEYAKEINREANFDYSAANTPELIRRGSVLTQQMFQFQKYPIMQFEFFWDNVVHGTNSQRIRFLVPYMLATGIAGCIPLLANCLMRCCPHCLVLF